MQNRETQEEGKSDQNEISGKYIKVCLEQEELRAKFLFVGGF
jgi:hypothetical protein